MTKADITIGQPISGEEFYWMIIVSLKDEIREKQNILEELRNEDVKRKIIQNWSPKIRNIYIHNI